MLACSVLAGCRAHAGAGTGKPVQMDDALKLEVLEGRCVAVYRDASRMTLEPKPPCVFAQNEGGRLRAFAYPDVKVDAALMVIGAPLSEEEREKRRLPADLFCGTEAQGILIKGGVARASKTTQSQGMVCATSGVDEKRFWMFAHEAP